MVKFGIFHGMKREICGRLRVAAVCCALLIPFASFARPSWPSDYSTRLADYESSIVPVPVAAENQVTFSSWCHAIGGGSLNNSLAEFFESRIVTSAESGEVTFFLAGSILFIR